jgi:hypothetical protein
VENFDQQAHDEFIAERYRTLAMFETFDLFIDRALDGVITMETALKEFREEFFEDDTEVIIE